MARNVTLFVYNDTKQDQDWTIYAEGVINESFKIGQVRKTFTLTLSGDTTIQFGVDDAVYLKATYSYRSDSWNSHTVTPNDIQFSEGRNAITVTSSYKP